MNRCSGEGLKGLGGLKGFTGYLNSRILQPC
jgi:hypothetical protein